jgi:hypothetical protein
MQDDFIRAEADIAGLFMAKQVRIPPQSLTVNDIIGFKIIDRAERIEEIPRLLASEPGIEIREIERHQGRYNADNLLLDMKLPPPEALAVRLRELDWTMAARRGLDPEAVRGNILEYLTQGSPSVRIEVILTTPEEFMESEFGRSIHELRILRLRQRQPYNGLLGQNAGYLIEYLLTLASSPTTRIEEIPIKMYGRYLPEEIEALKSELHGAVKDGGLLGTFSFQQPSGETPFSP